MKAKIAYTLDLTQAEADLLIDLVGNHVVGNSKTRRANADDIFQALYDAGVRYRESWKPGYDITGMLEIKL